MIRKFSKEPVKRFTLHQQNKYDLQDKYDCLVDANIALGKMIDAIELYQADWQDGFDETQHKMIDDSLITIEGLLNSEFNKIESSL